MIDSITRITLNLQETNTMVSIRAKRGDTGRKLLIHLSDGSIPYHISDDCYATFTAKKPDGTKINNACTIENNVIEYEFTEQTCAAPGTMHCEIKLYGADRKLITSACFLVNVYDTVFRDGDEASSEGEMNTLDDLILRANAFLNKTGKLLRWQGNWDSETEYEANDLVLHEEVLYVAEEAITAGTAPGSEEVTAWVPIAGMGTGSGADLTEQVDRAEAAAQNAESAAATANNARVQAQAAANSAGVYVGNAVSAMNNANAAAATAEAAKESVSTIANLAGSYSSTAHSAANRAEQAKNSAQGYASSASSSATRAEEAAARAEEAAAEAGNGSDGSQNLTGVVKSVNGKMPDEEGNVYIYIPDDPGDDTMFVTINADNTSDLGYYDIYSAFIKKEVVFTYYKDALFLFGSYNFMSLTAYFYPVNTSIGYRLALKDNAITEEPIGGSGGNVDLTGYATEQWVQDQEYLTAVPDGYAKTADIPTKVSELDNDSGYLTEHQSLDGYALKSEIPSVPVKSVNGKTGAVSLTAADVKARPDSWMPTASDVGALPSSTVIPTVPTKVSAFTNDAGYLTEHQDLSEYAKKTEIPAVPVKSVNGKTGAVSLSASDVKARPDTWMPSASDVGALPSTTVIPTVPTKLSAFTNDAGYLTQHQDISGKVNKNGLTLGIYTDGLIYVFVDGQPVGNGVELPTGGIDGYVDSDKNIVVRGLPDGSYKFYFEMEDGSLSDGYDLVKDSNVYYTVTNNLTNCTNSNSATQAIGGQSYSATITAVSGYELKSVTVTMGGSPVAVSGGVINIANVTGNIVIIAVAEEIKASYTNILTSGDYEVQLNKRFSSSNKGYTACNGMIALVIPIDDVWDKTIRFKGFPANIKIGSNAPLWMSIDANNTRVSTLSSTDTTGNIWTCPQLTDEGNGIYSVLINSTSVPVGKGIALAINMAVNTGTAISAIPADAIMTINEQIA